MSHKVTMQLGGHPLSLETGRIARQAGGAAWVQYGETAVLVTACRTPTPDERGFLPLTVEYREKAYAAGRIPGNFYKREARPQERETLNMRLVDHQIRPLFPKGFNYEVQVYISVLSHDGENTADVLGMVGASAALCLSDIPFAGPVGAVRVGRIDGELIVNPSLEQLHETDLDLIVSGTSDTVTSVEGSGREISEAELLESLEFAQGHIGELVELQRELATLAGKEKLPFTPATGQIELSAAIEELAAAPIAAANRAGSKEERNALLVQVRIDVLAKLATSLAAVEEEIDAVLEQLVRRDMRRMVLDERRRIDDRQLDEVRPLDCAVDMLPRAHGSALFGRGRTQALCTTTLGTRSDERMVDDLRGKYFKTFFLDYNFPPYSVGEVGPVRGPGRREIGHGLLAERAFEPILPGTESFPYTIRLVSDITESDSSSSMATVCGASLALMAAGVPVKTAVCGTGVGLVKEGDEWELLTDIQSAEDFLGDMDLKVAGTAEGITAIQMDVKIDDLDLAIVAQALERARHSRLHVLVAMNQCLAAPRPQLSMHAPRIETWSIDPEKIGAVIGPGGKTIRQIEKCGVDIHIEEDGTLTLTYLEADAGGQAREMIAALTAEPEVGQIYRGVVKSIKPFGAFVEILPGKEGLCHISEFADGQVERIEEVVSLGQELAVEVLAIDHSGKIRLSHKSVRRTRGDLM